MIKRWSVVVQVLEQFLDPGSAPPEEPAQGPKRALRMTGDELAVRSAEGDRRETAW
jgi:hypothetical protein